MPERILNAPQRNLYSSGLDGGDGPRGQNRRPREEVIALPDVAQQFLRPKDAARHPHHREHLVPVQVHQRAPEYLLVAPDHLVAAVEAGQLWVEVEAADLERLPA